MDNETTNEATKVTMERALQLSANASLGGNEEENSSNGTVDNGWGRIRGKDSTARPFKTKGLWEFVRRTLSYNNPVDPLRPLVVMTAENVAEHKPAEEDGKLAPHHVPLMNDIGIKRRTTRGVETTIPSSQAQKKTRREEQAIKFIKAGQLPKEEQREREELDRPQDNLDEKTAAVNKGVLIQEGGRKGDEDAGKGTD